MNYRYISIIPPCDGADSHDTEPVIAFLATLPRLKQVEAMSFENAAGHPWLSLTILKTFGPNQWADDGTFKPTFNRIELVASEGEARPWPVELAAEIAAFLEWDVVEEGEEGSGRPPSP